MEQLKFYDFFFKVTLPESAPSMHLGTLMAALCSFFSEPNFHLVEARGWLVCCLWF